MPVPAQSLAVTLALFAALALPAQDERPPEAFQLALGLQQRGLHEEAATRLQAFLKQEPRHPLAAEAWYRLGSSQAELKQAEAAMASLQKALGDAKMRYRPECLYRLANLERENNKVKEAAGRYGELVRGIAADHYLRVPALYAEGECRRDLSDDKAALAAFEAVVGAASQEQGQFKFAALYQSGFAWQRAADFQKAMESFAKAQAAAADDQARAECRYLCGDAALRGGDPARAEKEFQAAVQSGGEFADDAALGLGFCAVRQGKADQALRAFRNVLSRFAESPRAPEARLEVGRLLHGKGSFAEAKKELEPLRSEASLRPELKAQVEELLGLCALELGSGTDAAASLRAALATANPSARPRLQVALGDALAAQKQWQEALTAYDAVPQDAPADLRGEAMYGGCFCLHQLGRHADSALRAEQMRKVLPEHRLSVHAAFALAENRFAEKKWEVARASYALVPEGHELRPQATFKIAWCDYLQGKHAAAAASFQSIAQDAKHPSREEALSMSALAFLEAGNQDQAMAAADRYRATYPKGVHLQRSERVAARVLRARGDLPGAAARLRAAAAAGGEGNGLQDRLEEADLRFQQGDFKAAEQSYTTLADREDDLGARAREGLAWCAFELGDDQACSDRLQRAMAHPQAAPRKPGLLELKAALHQRRQQWGEAAATAQAFLQEFKTHARAPAMRYALGLCQSRGGDKAAARRTLAALCKDGGYERMDRVQYELGWACRRDGDEPAALAAFGEVVKTSKDPELLGEARLHLGQAALDQNQLDKARELLAAVEGSHRGRALYQIGFAELQAADKATTGKQALLQRAAASFTAIMAIGKGEALSGEATFCLGECRMRLQEMQPAADAFAALLQREPAHARAQQARLRLGECELRLGKLAESASHLDEFLRGKVEPAEKPQALLMLGKARLGRSEHKEAEAAFTAATGLSEGPIAAEAQFRLGESRKARGDLAGAAEAFVALPILYAHEEWVQKGLLNAGLCYQALQQNEKARKFFDELVRKYPKSAEAEQARAQLK